MNYTLKQWLLIFVPMWMQLCLGIAIGLQWDDMPWWFVGVSSTIGYTSGLLVQKTHRAAFRRGVES